MKKDEVNDFCRDVGIFMEMKGMSSSSSVGRYTNFEPKYEHSMYRPFGEGRQNTTVGPTSSSLGNTMDKNSIGLNCPAESQFFHAACLYYVLEKDPLIF